MKIIENADISKFSTLRVLAKAERLVIPTSLPELTELVNYIQSNGLNWNILGAGSNSLLSSRSIPGLTICTTGLDYIKQLDENIFEVGAGVKMPRFCAIMTKQSLSGTEFMEGIPGTVGGGVVMNAGAHGSEISKILISAKILNIENQTIEEFSKEKFGFQYRRSMINPLRHIVLSGTFALQKDSKDSIRQRVSKNNKERAAKQPIKAWTCGCTFMNLEDGYSTGKLIEEIGAKGLSQGSFHVSNVHGNFFENEGKGSSIDFCRLMSRVQDLAFEKRQVLLRPEVKRIGEFSQEEDLVWNPEKKFVNLMK